MVVFAAIHSTRLRSLMPGPSDANACPEQATARRMGRRNHFGIFVMFRDGASLRPRPTVPRVWTPRAPGLRVVEPTVTAIETKTGADRSAEYIP